MNPPDDKARYVMVGGFLGAGKTTALGELAKRLDARGRRVGLITNDQSQDLVDTRLLRQKGFPVEEIAGGCFCCRFASLREAADKLTEDSRPDVFLAEPVGSCTDLVATVSYPLRRMYGEQFRIAPLSVLVDPVRAARILGLKEGRSFSPKVVYVYRKQLEEARFLVVNKCDELAEEDRIALVDALRSEHPQASVFCTSAKTGDGLDAWLDAVWAEEDVEAATMAVDYDIYADGEALLGWMNATVSLEADSAIDANALMMQLATRLRDDLASRKAEIAHFKMTLDGGDPMGHLTVVSVVRSDGDPELRESTPEPVTEASIIVNLRAETNPNLLLHLLERALDDVEDGVTLTLEHEEHFRPGRPEPTHRVQVSSKETP